MADDNAGKEDRPHDVLAAEEFGVPAPDPQLHVEYEQAHDVLAAEEFGMGAPDPELHARQRGVRVPPKPEDPRGSEPPHDVLAAEEFGVPAPVAHAVPPGFTHPAPAYASWTGRIYLAAGVAATLVLLKLRRRRRAD